MGSLNVILKFLLLDVWPDQGLQTGWRGEKETKKAEKKERGGGECIVRVDGEKAPQDDNLLHYIATECTLENQAYYLFVSVFVRARETGRSGES